MFLLRMEKEALIMGVRKYLVSNKVNWLLGKHADSTGGMNCFERDETIKNMDKYANFLCWAKGTFVYPEDWKSFTTWDRL